ncbi:MAG TPA: glycosyltransferase [Pseudonocardiaceae bacterium]|jgi:GT2 family glycosyltransferase/glycosyltransferase involved in cell wall biosynthesis|nr:glycosyltransferase [Pseudonocardiaceae bacterium]
MLSVILVNYRGAEHTITCLRALRTDLDYPADRLQVVCVENGSGDGSLAKIRAAARELTGVTVVDAGENLGFAAGCNLGAKHATGEVLALLNNDARPHRDWARTAVAVLRADPTIAAVASRVLDWDGERVDFVDGGLTWFGMGYKQHAGKPLAELGSGDHERPRDVLFATGAAMFVRADVFDSVGGFDERFFMFYEDVDLGWRLNLRGWRVRYEPASLAYHRHHASMSEVDGSDNARESYLLQRNALAMIYKNYSDETLALAMPAALALTVRRSTADGRIDTAQLEITSRRADQQTPEPAEVSIPRSALAGLLAIDRFTDLLPELIKARAVEQAARVRTDADLEPLMRKAIEPANPLPRYLSGHRDLVEAFRLEEAFNRPRKILVITMDAVGPRMAGPAIRAWNMADLLAGEHDVRLVTANPHFEPVPAPFPLLHVTHKQLTQQAEWADIVILQGHALEILPDLKKLDSRTLLICDMYDPIHLELLEQGKEQTDEQRAAHQKVILGVLNAQWRRGDFFLCASDRQRHFWLGHFAALGRLTPELYDADPTAGSLLAVAPFGLPGKAPARTGPGLRAALPGISEKDKVVLWAGGVYSWFDPVTLVRAIGELRGRRSDVRLVFLGMRHPNPDVPEMDVAVRTRAVAGQLELVGEHVFFNEGWVPYGERQNWLLDADCGVTTHFQHVETTFAFRTRVLDYLWSSLPIVTTEGDAFADLVRIERLGVTVPPEDPRALAEALELVLYDEEFAAGCRERIANVREQFTWDRTLAPLLDYCRNPHPAADRLLGGGPLVHRPPLGAAGTLRRDVDLVREYLSAGGPTEVARRAVGRVRRIASTRVPGRNHAD